MTKEELDFIGSMNMCDEISNEAYKKIVCHCEEQEPCEDCISRAQAIYVASGYCHPANIAKELAKLPSVNPQPKTGHWIEHERNGIAHIECSECLSWFLRSHLLRNSYCPNCGTKMVEPQEGEG